MRKFLASLFCCWTVAAWAQFFNPVPFFPTAASGTVAVDSIGTVGTCTGVTSFNYTGLTISGGLSNSALTVELEFAASNITGLAMTWNGVALSQITTTNNASGGRIDLWGLVNPASGNQTLAVSWTTSTNCTVVGVSWSGVNQTGGTSTFANATTASGSSTTSSVTVTSATGDAVIAMHEVVGVGNSFSSVSNNSIFTATPAQRACAGNWKAATGSDTLTGTIASSNAWVSIGADIKHN
jgi:hypothetical protein